MSAAPEKAVDCLTAAEWKEIVNILRRSFLRGGAEPCFELWRHKKTGKLLAVRWEKGEITGAVRRKRRADKDLPVVYAELFAESRPELVMWAEDTGPEYEVVWSLADTLKGGEGAP